MIEIKVSDKGTNIEAHATAIDMVAEAVTAAYLLLETLSRAVQTEDIARSLLIDALTNEEMLQKFRENGEVNCEEETADA